MILLPAEHVFGKFSYLLSVIVLIITAIGYVVTSAKRKKQTGSTEQGDPLKT